MTSEALFEEPPMIQQLYDTLTAHNVPPWLVVVLVFLAALLKPAIDLTIEVLRRGNMVRRPAPALTADQLLAERAQLAREQGRFFERLNRRLDQAERNVEEARDRAEQAHRAVLACHDAHEECKKVTDDLLRRIEQLQRPALPIA